MSRSVTIRNPGANDGIVLTFNGSNVTFSLESDGSEVVVLSASALTGSAVVDVLTENSGAIGGTNDGDIPDLTTPDAAGNAAAVRELATTVNAIVSALQGLGVVVSS